MSRNPSKVSRQTVEETEKNEGVGKEGAINNYTEVEMSGSSVNFESMNIHGDITLVFKPHALVLIYEEKQEEILVKDVSLDPFFVSFPTFCLSFPHLVPSPTLHPANSVHRLAITYVKANR